MSRSRSLSPQRCGPLAGLRSDRFGEKQWSLVGFNNMNHFKILKFCNERREASS